MEQAERRVLAAGLALGHDDADGPPEPGGLDPLVEAPQHAAAVAKALEPFGYQAEPEDGGALDGVLRKAAQRGPGVLVVHVVGHGRLRAGTQNLYVVGPDGQDLCDPVGHWVEWVEDRGGKGPLTLFLLDVCHTGRALEAVWQRSPRAHERRAWVLGATGPGDLAYDFRLSRAVARVLGDYARETLRVDPSLQFIPLSTVGCEINRVVAELGAGSPAVQVLDSTPVRFTETAVMDQLPFLPNLRWTGADGRLSAIDAALHPFVDEALDEEHFASRASGVHLLGARPTRGYFRGRRSSLRRCRPGWTAPRAACGW